MLLKVLDVIDAMFVYIFDGLNEHCRKEINSINDQYPFEPLKVPVVFGHCLNLAAMLL